ncbi:beta strand repeat-containing protein [Burkholderia contaminans]|uniref:beta strand repeat-containing protein n=1 Tax=Burkholderia contaminans TaxID=488447 RepID=UPI00158DBFD5|nr:hypothetical protein [Burkholderia contaminans]
MKKILLGAFFALTAAAHAATKIPVQMLDPTGSTSGQTIVSSGPTGTPAWGGVAVGGLAPIAANTVVANVTGSSASPTAFAMPSCIASDNALRWAPGSGFTCANAIALKSSGLNQFAATTSAQLAGIISDETGTGSLVFSTSPTLGAMVATGQVSLGGAAGAEALRAVTTASAVNWVQVQGNIAGNGSSISAAGADTNINLNLSSKGSNGIGFYTGSLSRAQFSVVDAASAVNYLQVQGAPTGNNVSMSAQGSDTNVGINYAAKGNGWHSFQANGVAQVAITNTPGATRYLTLTGSNGGNPTIGASAGSVAFGSNVVVQGGAIDGTTIGATTANTGRFTTLTATGAITPSTTAGIVGTTAADSANAGSMGEFVNSNFSSVNMTTSGTAQNLTSISLTAGDWDVTGAATYTSGSGATSTIWIAGVNTTSATLPSLGNYFQSGGSITATGAATAIPPVTRINVSSTTTVYLVGEAIFSGGSVSAAGFLRARRVR